MSSLLERLPADSAGQFRKKLVKGIIFLSLSGEIF
jgi:hypothetical protein